MNSDELKAKVDAVKESNHRATIVGGLLADDQKQLDILYQLIPNFRAVGTLWHAQLFKEYKPRPNVVELTFYFRTSPEAEKQRVDAEFSADLTTDELGPHNVKITYWGPAVRRVQ